MRNSLLVRLLRSKYKHTYTTKKKVEYIGAAFTLSRWLDLMYRVSLCMWILLLWSAISVSVSLTNTLRQSVSFLLAFDFFFCFVKAHLLRKIFYLFLFGNEFFFSLPQKCGIHFFVNHRYYLLFTTNCSTIFSGEWKIKKKILWSNCSPKLV